MAAAGNQQDFNARLMGAAQRFHICLRNMKLGIQQGTVYINGQEPDGRSHCKNSNIGEAVASCQWSRSATQTDTYASLKSPR